MTNLNDLYLRYYYPASRNLPIIILLSGWGGDANTITEATVKRIGDLGAFVCCVGMRGRTRAGGSRDASAREIYDIYDAVTYVKENFSNYVDNDKVAVWGYSGGGGNALAACCKFPDTFSVGVSFFGISDYGRDNIDGWYYNNNGTYTDQISTSIGGTPVEVPNKYYARDAVAAIANYSGGHLHLYHDEDDTIVPSVHSTRIKNTLDAAGLSNYSYNISSPTDTNRWTHGYPSDIVDLQIPESDLVTALSNSSAWTIPASGTVTVIGYIVTKRFTIWLNDGLDAAAMVVYNTSTHQYMVTPLTTADITVSITEGALTAGGTISGEHTFTAT